MDILNRLNYNFGKITIIFLNPPFFLNQFEDHHTRGFPCRFFPGVHPALCRSFNGAEAASSNLNYLIFPLERKKPNDPESLITSVSFGIEKTPLKESF